MSKATIKERPILFSGQMVLAILKGRKTQTRRIIKNGPHDWAAGYYLGVHHGTHGIHQSVDEEAAKVWRGRCPYGRTGDRLWIRETWAPVSTFDPSPETGALYRADPIFDGMTSFDWKWKPSIHMPRWASRITLEITGVRAERLQDISEADAIAEGCVEVDEPQASKFSVPGPLCRYEHLWESINGPGAWALNPWVWVVEFHRVDPSPAGVSTR